MAMNRRNSIGAVVASASLGRMAIALAPSIPPSDAEQVGWLRSGLIDAGGTHEPYIFVVRRGGQRLDGRQSSEYERSEGLIPKLHVKGVEVFQSCHAYSLRATRKNLLVVSRLLGLLVLSAGCVLASAQQSSNAVATEKNTPAIEHWDGMGDSPANPGPLAHDLSSELTPAAIDRAVRKVGDWQLERAQPYFNQEWSFAVLYVGFMSAAKSLHEQRYEDAMLQMGSKFDWQLGPREIDPTYRAHGQAVGQTYDTDNQGLAQTYIELYEIEHHPAMIAATKAQFDELMTVKDRPDAPAWWFCDDLFVAAPSWMELYKATGNKAYLDYMNRQWWVTSKSLYDPQERLYFRDSSYFSKREQNGKKVFWSRGNGWVLAGYARVLEDMPKDYSSRPRYIKQFKQMASRIASLQSDDGLWRPALLDPEAHSSPEVSGSALFIYGLAWGVNHGILARKKYLPVVQAGWKGLLSHIYTDGRLGSIQAVASEPGGFEPSSSYVYGVGAFLLAGSEMKSLAK